jgi:hypothetical protein
MGQSPPVETVLSLSFGPLRPAAVSDTLTLGEKGMERRRVVLYGRSVILGSLNVSLQSYPNLEVVSLAPPLPSAQELCALAPDVILFDVETGRPEAAFSLLGTCPGLLLIGIDPSSNQALLWSGRHLRELSTHDLVRVMSGGDPTPSFLQDRNQTGA